MDPWCSHCLLVRRQEQLNAQHLCLLSNNLYWQYPHFHTRTIYDRKPALERCGSMGNDCRVTMRLGAGGTDGVISVYSNELPSDGARGESPPQEFLVNIFRLLMAHGISLGVIITVEKTESMDLANPDHSHAGISCPHIRHKSTSKITILNHKQRKEWGCSRNSRDYIIKKRYNLS
ncbi:hypothetical protein BGZ60DRAFT_101046 [Tricladium varicosporioides]|nr:hypothetical protein BGZ60DRAFT_101046 [Hymenoscyphus varicosporioides]